jgi:hypothetical protein
MQDQQHGDPSLMKPEARLSLEDAETTTLHVAFKNRNVSNKRFVTG